MHRLLTAVVAAGSLLLSSASRANECGVTPFNVTGPFPLNGALQDIPNAAFINLYMSNSWDATAPTGETQSALDAWTLALVNSAYWKNMKDYGINPPVFLGGFQNPAGCPLPSLTNAVSTWNVGGFVNCSLTAAPLQALVQAAQNAHLNVAVNVFLDPRMTAGNPTGPSCPGGGDPGYHSAAQDVNSLLQPFTVIATNPGCNPGVSNVTHTISHEMAEVITDPFGDAGWVHRFGFGDLDVSKSLSEGEVGDICESGCKAMSSDTVPSYFASPSFLGAAPLAVAPETYWSNSAQACFPNNWPLTAPSVSSVQAAQASDGVVLDISGSGFGDLASALQPSPLTGRTVALPLSNANVPYFLLRDNPLSGTAFNAGNSFDGGGDAVKLSYLTWNNTSIYVKLPSAAANTCDALSFAIWNPTDGSLGTASGSIPGPAGILMYFPAAVAAGGTITGTISLTDANGGPIYSSTALTVTTNGGSPQTVSVSGGRYAYSDTPTGVGPVKIQASAPCGSAGRASANVNVVPFIQTVAPDHGLAAGGTTVTITGSGFTGATSVQFGSVAAKSFTVVSDTRITAVTAAENPGSVAVVVTAHAMSSAQAPASPVQPGYTFFSPGLPVVTLAGIKCNVATYSISAWDASGAPLAGASVTISGSGTTIQTPVITHLDSDGTGQFKTAGSQVSPPSVVTVALSGGSATQVVPSSVNLASCTNVRQNVAQLGELLDSSLGQCLACVPFTDVPNNVSNIYVYDVAAWGVMSGIGKSFVPQGTVTRSQLVGTLAALAGPRAAAVAARQFGLARGAVAGSGLTVTRAQAARYIQSALQIERGSTAALSEAARLAPAQRLTRADLARALYSYIKQNYLPAKAK